MLKERAYLSILAVVCIAVVVVAGITNFIVDPYAMHGVVELVNVNHVKQESGTHARLYRANVISRRAPGVLALGTSRSARGISMDHPGWKGLPAERYNASLLGANIYEIERYFEHAHRTHPLTQVVVGLDFFAFNVYKHNQSDFNEALVLDAQRSSTLSRRLEMLKIDVSSDTLYSSWLTIRCNRRDCDPPFLPDGRENPALLERRLREDGGQRKAFRASAVLGLTRLNFPPPRADFALVGPDGETQLKHLARMIEIARKDHIDLRLFISPTHAIQSEVLRVAGLWPEFEGWKRQLVTLLDDDAHRHPAQQPIPLWDFSGYNSISTEPVPPSGDTTSRMKWYWESSHYRKELGDLVLDRLLEYESAGRAIPMDFGILLTRDNLVHHLNAIRLDGLTYRQTHAAEVAEVERFERQVERKRPRTIYALKTR
jgi:hypothetical protein